MARSRCTSASRPSERSKPASALAASPIDLGAGLSTYEAPWPGLRALQEKEAILRRLSATQSKPIGRRV